ncbi:restriction endonuclease subunit S [Salinivibrio costicola]|uniref:restriction endonuclease subunit S n=1 Tax=Salinivibrio costicola TaxID=51367 RepID=UPI003F6F66A7
MENKLMFLGLIGNDIPKHWKSPLLVDLVTPKQWKTIPAKNLIEKGYVVYGANGKIGFYSEYTHEKPTLMITCRGATCGNLHISEPYSYINGNAMALDSQPTDLVSLEFLFYALKARGLDDTISGSAQPQITGKGLQEVGVPLPPLAEQKVIAEKLDTLLAQVEATKTRLESTLETLKQFRQSVLAAAVSGKLTEDWRQNIAKYPHLHEAISELEKKALDNAPTKAKKAKLEKVYAGKEKPVSLDFKMPEKWLECNLAKLCEPFSYGSSSKSQASGDVPVLRMGNLQNGKLDWSDLVYTSNEAEINKYELQANDVLFNRTNSPELVGKTAIFKGERKAIYAGYLIKARCLSLLSPDYLNIVLNSPYGKDYCRSVKSDGVSQSNINAQKLGAFVIPLPSTLEQQEIVNRVEKLFAGADATELQVNQALERVNHLTQSILAKAFRGELTEQWRKDNPELISGENSAEALLEKIKAERAALKSVKKSRN